MGLASIMKNRNIKVCTKLLILKGYVWSVLLYGCECWTIDNEAMKRLEAAEMWFFRRMMRISWTEKKSNEEVLLIGYLKRTHQNHQEETDKISGTHHEEKQYRKTGFVWENKWKERQRETKANIIFRKIEQMGQEQQQQ